MRILVYVPQSRALPRAMESIFGLRSGHEVVWWVDGTGNNPKEHRFANITRKTERARRLALEEDYDALMLIDDDQIVPDDALDKLAAAGGDIAYGLTVWRNKPHWWSACSLIREPNEHVPINANPRDSQAAWGQVIEVKGVGSFCTLIWRRTLERVVFERRGIHCFDYYLATDAQRLGLLQLCDTSVLVGHMDEQKKQVLWPTPSGYCEEV